MPTQRSLYGNDFQSWTAQEVAEFLHIHPKTVHRLAEAEKLIGFQLPDSGHWRFFPEQVREFVDRAREASARPSGQTPNGGDE